MRRTKICTYCGNRATTSDHVIPKALWLEVSNERSIKVPSCGQCNWRSDEGLLKSFFSVFDDQLADKRILELLHPKGKGDLRRFLSCCSPDVKKVYPNELITKLLKKVFLGLRRYLLEDKWTFEQTSSLQVFTIVKESEEYVIRLLPLLVDDHNQGYILSPNLRDVLAKIGRAHV